VKSIAQCSFRRTTLAVAIAACCAIPAAQAANRVTSADLAAYADRANFAAASEQIQYKRYIVTYAQGSAELGSASAMKADFERVAAETGLSVSKVRTLATGAELVEVSGDRMRFSSYAGTAREVMVSFARNPAVAYVEPDRLMRPTLTPNDTYFSNQWDLTDATGGANVPSAWDISTGSGIKVAVIDTGITTHSDLAGQTVGGYDFISDSDTARDGNARDSDPQDEGDWYATNECGYGYGASDSSWHGTHVAGTIAAKTNNGAGVAGMAYGAKVVPVRVLGKCGGYTSDIVDAMVWSAGGSVSGVPSNANPARVLNLSLGGSGSCGSFQSAVNSARANGAVVVVAAGNENQNVSNSSPANCSGVISVAATTKTGSRASYSNYGSSIVVSAPGGAGSGGSTDILSTLNSGTTTPSSETYAYYAGTSMAAPHVAALAAMVLSVDPSLTPDEVKDLITDNARPLPGSCSGGCGAGIIDAHATLVAAGGGGGGSNAAPTANFTYTTSGLTASFTDTSSDSDGSIVSRSWNFGDGSTSSSANPSHTYASAGTYTVTLTVTDDDSATNTKTQSVTVSSGGGGGGGDGELENGVAETGLAATTGNKLYFTLQVPAGASNLAFVTSGGSGDGDLYVKFGSNPTTSSYDCRSWNYGNSETCTIANPQAGTYHVMINAYSSFSGMSLTGSYSGGGGGGGDPEPDEIYETGLSATRNNWTSTYTIDVPAGASNLAIAISGGSGDADLYVQRGSTPTTSSYLCRPYRSGNNETCSWTAPTAGTYYVRVRAYSTFSGVTLTGTYDP